MGLEFYYSSLYFRLQCLQLLIEMVQKMGGTAFAGRMKSTMRSWILVWLLHLLAAHLACFSLSML